MSWPSTEGPNWEVSALIGARLHLAILGEIPGEWGNRTCFAWNSQLEVLKEE